MKAAIGLSVTLAWLGLAPDADAADGEKSRVVIAAPAESLEAMSDVERRLGAELSAAGFEVVKRKADVPESAEDGARSTFAWIVLSPGKASESLAVWVKDPRTGAVVTRLVDASDIDEAEARAALALRTVESLRASLLSLDPRALRAMPADVAAWAKADSSVVEPPAPSPEPDRASPRAKAKPDPVGPPLGPPVAGAPYAADADHLRREQSNQLWVSLSMGALISSGALGLSLGPRIAVEQELPYRFSIGGSVIGTLPAHEVAVDCQQLLALLRASYTIGPRWWVVSPHVGLSVGAHAYRSTIDVSSAVNTVKGGQAGLGFAPTADLGAVVNVAKWGRISVEGSAVFVVPQPELFEGPGFADDAHVPLITTSIGFELSPSQF